MLELRKKVGVMLLELQTALRFLRPQKSQVARTLIALSSLGVVSIVTWLVIVFYSVTEGLEKRWIDQLIQVSGSVRIYPTYSYFDHPDFLIDSYCESSSYQPTLLTEKINSPRPDDDFESQDLPAYFSEVMDPTWVRPSYRIWQTLKSLPSLSEPAVALSSRVQFEVTQFRAKIDPSFKNSTFASAGIYRMQQSGSLIGFYPKSQRLNQVLQSPEIEDWNHLMLSLGQSVLQKPWPLLESYLSKCTVEESNWTQDYIPVWPSQKICSESSHQPTWIDAADWEIKQAQNAAWNPKHNRWMHLISLQKKEGALLTAWVPAGFLQLKKVHSLAWDLEAKVETSDQAHDNADDWIPLLAPKILKDAGLRNGSMITIEKEMTGPLGKTLYTRNGLIIGFYDSGMMPLGGRFLISSYEEILPWIEPSEQDPEGQFFQAWPQEPLKSSRKLKKQLHDVGLSALFDVQSYEDYDASHDLLLQLRSDRLLLSLIAFIILIVASSSVCTMMLLLVNERRKEIAVLKTLGMPSGRLCACFALAGLILGLLGACIGVSLAWVTLENIDSLISCISYFQGGPLLNPAYYGKKLPTSMSFQAVKIALLGNMFFTLLGSSLAAWQTSRMKPADLFRSLS